MEHYDFYDICPICTWEDDPVQKDDPDFPYGANRLSLNQSRDLFSKGVDLLRIHKTRLVFEVKYLGESDPLQLLNGKVFEVIDVEKDWYRIFDETNESFLYPPERFEVVCHGYPCPCCEQPSLQEEVEFALCPVCGWKDDYQQRNNVDFKSGANEMNLHEARTAYKNCPPAS